MFEKVKNTRKKSNSSCTFTKTHIRFSPEFIKPIGQTRVTIMVDVATSQIGFKFGVEGELSVFCSKGQFLCSIKGLYVQYPQIREAVLERGGYEPELLIDADLWVINLK